jgi:outer membrane biosynthesis protein TonB
MGVRERGSRKGAGPRRARRFAALAAALVTLAARSAASATPTIVPPRRIDTAEVRYPPGGKGDAAVTLVVVIDRNGDVLDVGVREGSPPFSDAAVAGVRAWHFSPAAPR